MGLSLNGTSWQTGVSVLALLISGASAWFTWNGNADARKIAERQSYEAFVDTRIAHCTSLSQSYATQSWAYGNETADPDPELEEFAHKSVAIARAARLCRNTHSDLMQLQNCVATFVDKPEGHFVEDIGADGITYDNLVC